MSDPVWIQAVAAMVQSLAALGIVVLTIISLIVLRQYAADTRQIAEDSASQIERAQKPFLALTDKPKAGAAAYDNWFLENQGFGPALNIRCSRHFRDGPSETLFMSPIAAGAERHIELETARQAQTLGFRADYESLSGRKYATILTVVEHKLHTNFVEQAPKKTKP